ncbi:hypothetical protein ACWEN3_35600 [Streptomyces sp. NPDC004561]
MENDPGGPFGSRCYTLTLFEAIDRGICAPYQVVCLDITDTQLQAAQFLGAKARSDPVRGARLTALLKASSKEDFRRTRRSIPRLAQLDTLQMDHMSGPLAA